MIAPKVIWIGCAFATLGITTAMIHLFKPGQMILVGCSSIAVASAVIVLYFASGRGPAVVKPLYRAIPILLLGIYLLVDQPSGNPGFY